MTRDLWASSWERDLTICIKVTGQVKEQLGGKTKEMTDFREKYQIMVQGTVWILMQHIACKYDRMSLW